MHAYIVCAGNADSRLQTAEKILKSRGVGENPIECLRLKPMAKKTGGLATLTIAGVRTLSRFVGLQSNKPRGVIIEEAQNLTLPAQHAMLKTLEEPGGENREQRTENRDKDYSITIILTADSETSLLPTIRSRCKIIRLTDNQGQGTRNKGQGKILETLENISTQPPAEKILSLYSILSEFTGKNVSPHQGSIPRQEAINFLEAIINNLHQSSASGGNASTSCLQSACLAHRRLKNNANVQLALQQFILDIPKM